MSRLVHWWRALWSRKLGMDTDTFPDVFADLQVRLLIVQKRVSALTPTAWTKDGY